MGVNRWVDDLGAGVRSVVTNASHLAVSSLLGYAVRALYIFVVAGVLGPRVYGLLAYAQSWYITFLPLAALGIGSVLGRELGRSGAGAFAVVDASLALRFISVAMATLLCVGIGWWNFTTLEQRTLLIVVTIALSGRGLALWSYHVFIGMERARFALRQDRLFRPLEAAVGIGLVYLDFGILSLALWHAAVWWLQAIHGVVAVRRHIFLTAPRWETPCVWSMARTGAPIAIAGTLAGWMVTGPLILYARQPDVTRELVGQLALPLQICAVLYGLMHSASQAAVPVLSRSVARMENKDVKFLVAIALGALVVGGIGSLAGFVMGTWLNRTMLGASYAQQAGVFAAAVGLLVPLTIASAAVQILIARGRGPSLILFSGLGAAAFSITLPWSVEQFGPLGAIAAAGLGSLVWAATASLSVVRNRHPAWRRAVGGA